MAPEFYYKRSFTLIELLVVIAIIGLLASIVVVNVNSARDKAKIAKSIQFSSSVYHALGSEAVGYWDFNEILPGNTVRDISGNGNTGTVNGATLVDSLVFPGGNLGKALSFNGVSDYVNCGNNTSLQISNVISLEAWVYLKSLTIGVFQEIITKYRVFTGYYLLLNSSGYFQGAFLDGVDWGSSVADTVIPSINTWYHLVYTYDGATHKIYRDGTLVNSRNDAGGIANTIDDCRIGGFNVNRYANALVDDVRIYSQALGAAEIQKHYAEGLEKHQLAKE